jgi:hypothetical protein
MNQSNSLTISQRQVERLSLYLRFENWSIKDAICLLGGIDPENSDISWPSELPSSSAGVTRWTKLRINRYMPFDKHEEVVAPAAHLRVKQVEEISNNPLLSELVERESALDTLWRIWVSGGRTKNKFPPAYFIQWASKVGHQVAWLEWAEQKDKLPAKPSSSSSRKEVSNDGLLDEFKGKRRASAFRLIAGLLRAAYSMDVESPKYGAMGQLYASLYNAGTEMDEDTLRSLVQESAQVVKMDRERSMKNDQKMSSEKRIVKMQRQAKKTEILRKNRNTT